MKILLKYHYRLGDVIRVLSLAKQLDEKGHSLYVECNAEYHSIFKICPYAMPVKPGQTPPPGFKFDLELDLQIWPNRYNYYRATKKPWWDFVTSLHPLLYGMEFVNPFVEPYPHMPIDEASRYCVVANTGYSQEPKPDPRAVTALAKSLYPGLTTLHLGKADMHGPETFFQATDLCHLVSLVKHAGAIVTIATSIDLIAAKVREGVYHVIPNLSFNGQEDFQAPNQIRHPLV
jgi:hypothetical protein